ncbi:MAG: prephenate dehydrogenase [Anaerolineales bacterium]|uniref:Prephenate dehydrogenase n=1 Tax=Candidatus Desulfolinea nitratireducens TaxID=2841698 RepID=A0A8J6NPP9_9CHLR|nr:prephenate dehydrogenase [Candidatus Desulfolinea nitratireducens]
MEESNFLHDQNIAILGLGLMGASLAMGLRGHCNSLLGADSDPETCQIALAKGVVDSASTDLRQVLPEADILIIATPVAAALEIIAELPRIHNGGKLIVTDLTSTKIEIMCALESLPSNFDIIGGHPICGKETLGISNAEKEMLEGCIYTLTPSGRTSERTKTLAAQLVDAIGATPLWIDAKEHDRTLAATSHAPHLLSVALTHATEKKYARLSGGGFSSATRLASTPTSMMLSMVMTNADNTIEALEKVKTEIDKILALMKAGDEVNLEILLDASKNKREEMMRKA